MKESFLRRLASSLLRVAIRVAPKATVGWAQAILGELGQVDGDWSALLWAIGGAWVVAKQAVFSVFKPRDGQDASGEEILGKESPMRKTTQLTVGACVFASLLFFLAPVFRQAFRVSLAPWDAIVHVEPRQRQSSLIALGQRAKQDRDAEGLAFVAARQRDASESARLADEAVRIDPGLTWLYAVVAVNHPEIADTQRWVPELTKWDPGNALPYLIAAESIDIDEEPHTSFFVRPGAEDESPAWQNAMAAAFASPKLDTYRARLKALDRRVVQHYGFTDIYQIVANESQYDDVPSYADSDSYKYAKAVLKEANLADSRGDHRGAVEKYLGVARFIQVVAGLDRPPRPRMSRIVQAGAYRQLAIWAERDGEAEQSALYTSLADSTEQTNERELRFLAGRFRAGGAGQWSAILIRISGAMMLLCAILFVLGIAYFLKRVSSSQPKTKFSSRLSSFLSVGGASGLLLSSLTLYLNYRPYAEIFQTYLRTGDESWLPELSEFLGYTQFPFGVTGFDEALKITLYFWAGVTLLCLAGLLFVLTRYFLNRPHATATI
jgi:hypothetical protein